MFTVDLPVQGSPSCPGLALQRDQKAPDGHWHCSFWPSAVRVSERESALKHLRNRELAAEAAMKQQINLFLLRIISMGRDGY
jgi:hypothetical protein